MAVLSFLGNIQFRLYDFSLFMQKNKNTKSLQVPCSPFFIIYNAHQPGKRVLPFTSEKRMAASMTVEAAFVLPLFVFFSVALLMPIKWLDTQRKVQTVTERCCEKLSLYTYVIESGSQSLMDKNALEQIGLDEEEMKSAAVAASDFAAGLWLKGQVKEYADQVQIKTSKVMGDQEEIYLDICYRESIPFFDILPDGVVMNIAAKRRCWIGFDGKLREAESGTKQTDVDKDMVYVGASMGRYHLYRDCHYISNDYQEVLWNGGQSIRNSYGILLQACGYCAKEVNFGDTVYITQYGEHYHGRQDCEAMNAYVRKVPLEEVEYLGCCSYCTRKENGSS